MKRIKMVLYGEPGVGKSVFASKAPKPFFICTDGNYEWLEDFGADPDAHINCNTWSEIKNVILKPSNFDNYETVVLDLTEDAFKWCEQEFCVRQKLDHISDVPYGKGYDITRTEFFIDICKLFSLDKHIILIMHGITTTVKDRRGVEHTKYGPSARLPEKLIDQIEGRVRYFLRCYVKDIEFDDGTIIKQRFLSLVPKPNEFGIIRGVDETQVPQDIPLDWDEFAKVIGLNTDIKEKKTSKPVIKKTAKTEVEKPKEESDIAPWEEVKGEQKELPFTMNAPEAQETPQTEEIIPDKETGKEESLLSDKDKRVAALKAKLAAMKK